MSYNGWANYETWLVNIWLTNDQGMYEFVQELINGAKDMYSAIDALKDFVDELVFESLPDFGLHVDLLNGALEEVNWYELVESYATKENTDDE